MDWIQTNWINILAIIGGIDIVLGVVVKMTKTTWDDNLYTAIHNIVSKIVKK